MNNMDGTVKFTYLGVDFTVPSTLKDDWEFIEAVADLTAGELAQLPHIVRSVSGNKYDDLKTAATRDGHVSTEAMVGVVEAAMEAIKDSGDNGPKS